MNSNVDMATTTPRLCAGGCGFFGTAEKQGLCSKCYNDRLKETIAIMQASDDLKIDVSNEKEVVASDDAINPSAKRRCSVCTRKLGLLWYVCRCGGGFCSSHRHPEAHACTFDFKGPGKISIEDENPNCEADKMTSRI